MAVASVGLIAAPFARVPGIQDAGAAKLPQLSPDDPQAKALGYVHAAAEAKDHAAYKEGAHCANCAQWTGGDAEWGGCKIFPGKGVNRDGWCSAWVEQS